MFPKDLYIKRREELKKQVSSGLILLPGNSDVSFNYPGSEKLVLKNISHFQYSI